MVVKSMLRHQFDLSIWEWGLFKEPLLSTYKRWLPSPRLNNTIRKRGRSKSNTPRLRP
jgi:hypothetical protein